MFKIWKITTLAVTFLFLIFVWLYFLGFSADQPGSFYNKGNNAVWLGHEWVGVYKTDSQIQKLVETFRKHDIKTVFVHSGPFEKDGGVEENGYAFATNFIEKAKKFDKEIQYQAWLGQIRGKIDLNDREVRHNMAKQAFIFTQLVGFDGVHFDIEPVWDGDTNFIELLKETKNMIPKNKKMSVALAEFIPKNFLWIANHFKPLENYNTEVIYKNVARYADQIITMTYDTSLDKEWKYIWLVMEQTIRVTSLLDGKEVFIGLPAYQYDEKKDWFDPEVENIRTGLLGVTRGLNHFRSETDNFQGVAIYPFWEIDENEWQIYDDIWLK
ncbi:hypothetical protein COU74_05280 [Candidatus Peregrinibacteria bacterium CG10_big_fil_rev_8_21_14_0_10_36_19]|nr:MAG: hypothetical protein COU74_05280 [Candidatus Peregrinibacteria bacterium CG10_big_fil_rev_8_21_14_0_10_36_19]